MLIVLHRRQKHFVYPNNRLRAIGAKQMLIKI